MPCSQDVRVSAPRRQQGKKLDGERSLRHKGAPETTMPVLGLPQEEFEAVRLSNRRILRERRSRDKNLAATDPKTQSDTSSSDDEVRFTTGFETVPLETADSNVPSSCPQEGTDFQLPAELMQVLQGDRMLPSPGAPMINVILIIEDEGLETRVAGILDTGSQRTCVSSSLMYAHYGRRATLDSLQIPEGLPVLESASGHKLDILGAIFMIMKVGKFTIRHAFIVYEHSSQILIIGNDLIKDNFVIDRSQFVKFQDSALPAVPINYKRVGLVAVLTETVLLAQEERTHLPVRLQGAELAKHRTGFFIRTSQAHEMYPELDVWDTVNDVWDPESVRLGVHNTSKDQLTVEAGAHLANFYLCNDLGSDTVMNNAYSIQDVLDTDHDSPAPENVFDIVVEDDNLGNLKSVSVEPLADDSKLLSPEDVEKVVKQLFRLNKMPEQFVEFIEQEYCESMSLLFPPMRQFQAELAEVREPLSVVRIMKKLYERKLAEQDMDLTLRALSNCPTCLRILTHQVLHQLRLDLERLMKEKVSSAVMRQEPYDEDDFVKHKGALRRRLKQHEDKLQGADDPTRPSYLNLEELKYHKGFIDKVVQLAQRIILKPEGTASRKWMLRRKAQAQRMEDQGYTTMDSDPDESEDEIAFRLVEPEGDPTFDPDFESSVLPFESQYDPVHDGAWEVYQDSLAYRVEEVNSDADTMRPLSPAEQAYLTRVTSYQDPQRRGYSATQFAIDRQAVLQHRYVRPWAKRLLTLGNPQLQYDHLFAWSQGGTAILKVPDFYQREPQVSPPEPPDKRPEHSTPNKENRPPPPPSYGTPAQGQEQDQFREQIQALVNSPRTPEQNEALMTRLRAMSAAKDDNTFQQARQHFLDMMEKVKGSAPTEEEKAEPIAENQSAPTSSNEADSEDNDGGASSGVSEITCYAPMDEPLTGVPFSFYHEYDVLDELISRTGNSARQHPDQPSITRSTICQFLDLRLERLMAIMDTFRENDALISRETQVDAACFLDAVVTIILDLKLWRLPRKPTHLLQKIHNCLQELVCFEAQQKAAKVDQGIQEILRLQKGLFRDLRKRSVARKSMHSEPAESDIDSDEQEDETQLFVQDMQERKEILADTGGHAIMPRGIEPLPAGSLDRNIEELRDPNWWKKVQVGKLSEPQRQQMYELVQRHPEAFSKSPLELGSFKYFKVDLRMKPGYKVVSQRYRQIHPKDEAVVQQSIDKLLLQGAIRPSQSNWSSNLVLVRRKLNNGQTKVRVCWDARGTNSQVSPINWVPRNIPSCFQKVALAELRAFADVASAYYNMHLTEESMERTAFWGPSGRLMEHCRLPFGLQTASASFLVALDLVTAGAEFLTHFSDDIGVCTRRPAGADDQGLFETHLRQVESLFARLEHAGFKLAPDKTMLGLTQETIVDYLGYEIHSNLMYPQQAKIEKMQNFPRPTSKKAALSFASLCSFYRQLIPGFGQIAKPIYATVKKDLDFVWTTAAQAAMDKLKKVMTTRPFLRIINPALPYILYCDASNTALGGVLEQYDPAEPKLSWVVGYASRLVTPPERKLHSGALEILAILYCLTNWRYDIQASKVLVKSDCRAWTYLFATQGASSRMSRIALTLGELDIEIVYVPGEKNKAADALSRAHEDHLPKMDNTEWLRDPRVVNLHPPDALKDGKIRSFLECKDIVSEHVSRTVTPDELHFLQHNDTQIDENESVLLVRVMGQAKASVSPKFDTPQPEHLIPRDEPLDYSHFPLDTEEANEELISLCTDEASKMMLIATRSSEMSVKQLQYAQAADDYCGKKIKMLLHLRKRKLLDEQGYFLKHGVLMKLHKFKGGMSRVRLVIPRSLVKVILYQHHGNKNHPHLGPVKTYDLLAMKHIWPDMNNDVKHWVNNCMACALNKQYPVRVSTGSLMIPLGPLHIVYIDVMGALDKSFDGKTDVLVIIDGYSKWMGAIALANLRAEYIVKMFMEHFLAFAGFPRILISDNSFSLANELATTFYRALGVEKRETPLYRPSSDLCELAVKNLGGMMRRHFCGKDKKYWTVVLPFLLMGHNACPTGAQKLTPNEVFYGRMFDHFSMPLVPEEDPDINKYEYVQAIRRAQNYKWQVIQQFNQDRIIKYHARTNKDVFQPDFQPGDLVMIKDRTPKKANTKKLSTSNKLFIIVRIQGVSLICVSFGQAKTYNEMMLDPELFKTRLKSEAKPTKLIAETYHMNMCKPVPWSTVSEMEGHNYDPEIVTQFLKCFEGAWHKVDKITAAKKKEGLLVTFPDLESCASPLLGHNDNSRGGDEGLKNPNVLYTPEGKAHEKAKSKQNGSNEELFASHLFDNKVSPSPRSRESDHDSKRSDDNSEEVDNSSTSVPSGVASAVDNANKNQTLPDRSDCATERAEHDEIVPAHSSTSVPSGVASAVDNANKNQTLPDRSDCTTKGAEHDETVPAPAEKSESESEFDRNTTELQKVQRSPEKDSAERKLHEEHLRSKVKSIPKFMIHQSYTAPFLEDLMMDTPNKMPTDYVVHEAAENSKGTLDRVTIGAGRTPDDVIDIDQEARDEFSTPQSGNNIPLAKDVISSTEKSAEEGGEKSPSPKSSSSELKKVINDSEHSSVAQLSSGEVARQLSFAESDLEISGAAALNQGARSEDTANAVPSQESAVDNAMPPAAPAAKASSGKIVPALSQFQQHEKEMEDLNAAVNRAAAMHSSGGGRKVLRSTKTELIRRGEIPPKKK